MSTPTAAISGVTYTRWGRTSCPSDTEAQLVYSGRAGGTNYNARGGSAERICLPDNPDYIPGSIDLSPSPANHFKSVVQGAKLHVNYGVPGNPLQHLHYQNVPYVQSVLFLSDLQPSWCQLKQCVCHPGPESTMAT